MKNGRIDSLAVLDYMIISTKHRVNQQRKRSHVPKDCETEENPLCCVFCEKNFFRQ